MNSKDDEKIIALFWDRSESAIRQTQTKYGRYLLSIANNVLADEQNSLECLNDTLLAAWNSIPPERPLDLKVYLAKVIRNIAVSRWRGQSAAKRGSGQADAVLDEVRAIGGPTNVSDEVTDRMVLSQLLNAFLKSKSKKGRALFIKRYWLFMSIREISESTGISESNVKVILYRMRTELREILIKEGFEL